MPITQQIGSSSLSKPGVCTSTTRPSSPYDGMVIYETDTDRTLVWNGSAWVYLSTSTANPVGMEFIASASVSSATAYVEFLNCFSSRYTNYRIECDDVHVSVQGSLILWFGSSAAGATGYNGSMYYDRSDGGLTGVVRGNNIGWIYLMLTDNAAGGQSGGAYDIQNPQAATRTTVHGTYMGRGSYSGWTGGVNASNTQWTACRIANDGGNINTGNFRIYGYRNSA